MAINSISNGSGSKPLNISDSQKPVHVGNAAQNNNAVASTSSTATDTVSLTGTASQLRSLEQQLSSLPVVDIQRVDAVKREISNGTFEIDPPKIADKMIQIESAINQRLI